MPFPRVKQRLRLRQPHPLAAMCARHRQAGRVVDDFISFVDLAPTSSNWPACRGRNRHGGNLRAQSHDIFRAERAGRVNPPRPRAHRARATGRGAAVRLGLPVRGIVTDQFLYLLNFEPSRWPSAIRNRLPRLRRRGNQDVYPRRAPAESCGPALGAVLWAAAGEELYDLRRDPDCLRNLADSAGVAADRAALTNRLFTELSRQGDPA